MPTTIDVPGAVRGVIDVIKTRGWTRDSLTDCPDLTDYNAGYDPDDDTTWPVCLLGGINVVTGREARYPYEGPAPDGTIDTRDATVLAIVQHLGLDQGRGYPDEVLAEWNDAHTSDEVLSLLQAMLRA